MRLSNALLDALADLRANVAYASIIFWDLYFNEVGAGSTTQQALLVRGYQVDAVTEIAQFLIAVDDDEVAVTTVLMD